jgi:LmbE family N-acetylglucosaminyl deacetylase
MVTALDIETFRAPVLIVAPHPDDESIGCGGLIAKLRRRAVDVHVVIVTDGTGSHPNSRSHPPSALAALRESEALAALVALGVPAAAVAFWRLGDRFVPAAGEPGFENAVARAQMQLRTLAPGTLVLPNRSDAHGDHRAASQIWRQAAAEVPSPPRVLEYLVWPDPAQTMPIHPLSLDIADVLPLKIQAIAAHRSQHGQVITDDPTGFSLPPELLSRASEPREIFFEPVA